MFKFMDRRWLYGLAFVLFALSLGLPAVSTNNEYAQEHLACIKVTWLWGWLLFLMGPIGIGLGQLGWLANPLMFLAVLLRKRKPSAAILAGLATAAIAVTMLTLRSFASGDAGGDLVCHFGPGYYFWLVSSISLWSAILLEPG